MLRSGLSVIDVGCGPGSITLDIAAAVAPDHEVGVDREPGQIETARGAALAAALANVGFETGSAYELPFADEAFDLAFAHALVEHLREPLLALVEIRRVLRPGGHIALRSPDWGGFVLWPADSDLDAAIVAYRDMQTRNGGDVFIGRRLGALLRASGFRDVIMTASYEIYPDPTLIGEYLARQLEAAEDTVSASALRSSSRHPDALFAQAWYEALGTR